MAEASDPLQRFTEILGRARATGMENPDAMALATVSPEGWPSARQVLLKRFDERGFVFYTNLDSPKAHDLAADPRASLNFYWRQLAEQVRIRGRVEPVADEEADAYFATRDRGSQLGAWASHQSRPLESKARLLAEVARYEARFLGRQIPRPVFWSGFRLVPESFEFWRSGRFRLHDRFLYERVADGWKITRLSP